MRKISKISERFLLFISLLILILSCKKDKPITQNPIIFNPDLTYGTMTDYDGNEYKTITIGTQIWMAENLKTTKFNDGIDIPLITDYNSWNNSTTPAYSWYDNNSTFYKSIYGALYNAYTINTGRLCPLGWSVPNNNDLTTLVTFLGDTAGTYPYSARAGNKLREIDTYHWTIGMAGGAGVWYPSTNVGTNESGFTALPCGRRGGDGSSVGSGSNTYWWSSSVHVLVGNNWYWSVGNVYGGVASNYDFSKNYGFSVRCLKIN